MDSLPDDQRLYLQELAMEAIAAVAAGTPRVAYERIEADKLDSEQKTALWSILDSKTRSAIKVAANSSTLKVNNGIRQDKHRHSLAQRAQGKRHAS